MDELNPPCDVPLPSWLVRLLPDLSNAALRVALVVLCETAGWETESAILSRADFADRSGLAPSSVQVGIEEALKLQLLQRASVGMSYAYRLKVPSDLSPFPTTPSRNVTALRQLHRLQARLEKITELERTSVERGQRSSFETADCPAVRGDDGRAVSPNDHADSVPDRNSAKHSAASNEADQQSVRADDRCSAKASDLDRQAVEGVDRTISELDRLPVSPLTEARSAAPPTMPLRPDRQSVKLLVNHCEQASLPSSRAPMYAGAQWKSINNLLTTNHTHTVCERVHERASATSQLSVFRYAEVFAYAESLKGIRNPGGLAVVYWRSGEMDAEIANFQLRQAEIAEQQAAEAAEREAETRALAAALRARGEPLAEWERDLIAFYEQESQEEHNEPIQRLDARHRSVV